MDFRYVENYQGINPEVNQTSIKSLNANSSVLAQALITSTIASGQSLSDCEARVTASCDSFGMPARIIPLCGLRLIDICPDYPYQDTTPGDGTITFLYQCLYTSPFYSGEYNQYAGVFARCSFPEAPTPTPSPEPTPSPTPRPSPTPAPTPPEVCPIAPLTPLTDPVAIQFEAAGGDIADISTLSSEVSKGHLCLTRFLSKLGENPITTSGYRPPEYQAHLREIYLKHFQLLELNPPTCTNLASEIEAEFQLHRLGGSETAPATNSEHSLIPTKVFDLSWGNGLKPEVLSDGKAIDSYACRCGLRRPYAKDKVHFTEGPKCN